MATKNRSNTTNPSTNEQKSGRFEVWLAKTASQLRFLWQEQKVVILVGLGAAVVGYWFTKPLEVARTQGFWAAAEPLVTMVTLLVGIAIWLGENREDWEESLPKRLHVTYFYQGQKVLEARDAALASAADIRALAQQIGRQSNKSTDLRFEPAVAVEVGRPERRGAIWVKPYRVRIELTQKPEHIPESEWPKVWDLSPERPRGSQEA